MSLTVARPARRTTDLRALAAELRPAPVMVGAMTVAAFVLHLSQMHQSLFADEVIAYHEVTGHSLRSMIHTLGTGGDLCPPLYFVLAWFSVKLGDPTVWIRLPSLFLGAATIPLIYLLGRDTIGRAAGAIGAAVFTVSPFALFYGVQARPYATAAFFTVLSTCALVRAVRTDERRWWALYALAAVAAAYTHYTTVFVLVGQAAWGVWACRTRWRRPLFANLAVVVLYLPWLPSMHGGPALREFAVIERFTASHVLQDLVRYLVGYQYAPLHAIPTVPGFAAIAVCALVGGVQLLRRYLSRRAHGGDHDANGRLPLIAALALATPVGVLLYSLLGQDIWHVENLYASAPAAALVLGALLVAIPRGPRLAAVAVVLGVLVFGTIRALSPSWIRPPYRAVARYLDQVARPRDPVLLFTYRGILDDAIPAQLKRPHTIIAGVPRRWPRRPAGTPAFVVVDNVKLHRLRRALAPAGYVLVARRRYSGAVSFTLFTYRAV
jgi:mannosyltransferase